MEIIIGKNAGLCSVAQRAIDKLLEETKNGSVYCLGEIVHNRNVIDSLKKAGVCFINNIDESKGTTIIGAHGVTKDIYDKAEKMNLDILDLTCPNVLRIHKLVKEYLKKAILLLLLEKLTTQKFLKLKVLQETNVKT